MFGNPQTIKNLLAGRPMTPGWIPLVVPLFMMAACAAPQTESRPTSASPSQPAPAVDAPASASSPRTESPPPLVTVEDGVIDEGLECFKITTPNATYFYDKQGAGFSSLLDRDGQDWLGFRPGGGPQGEYRGIPNMVLKTFGHPGASVQPGIVSQIESRDPDKVVISSRSADGRWAVKWTIHPDRAVLQVEKTDGPYWFLYEGTPGGSFEPDQDYFVRGDGDGKRQPASASFADKMQDPQWIYFGDTRQDRVLLLVKQEADCWPDRYFPMDGMTVFGFGRGTGIDSHIRGRATFAFSLIDSADHAAIAARAATLTD